MLDALVRYRTHWQLASLRSAFDAHAADEERRMYPVFERMLAAIGELVVERSGVLNLGVEGMMIVGAACGFGGAWLSGSIIIGALCGIAAEIGRAHV